MFSWQSRVKQVTKASYPYQVAIYLLQNGCNTKYDRQLRAKNILVYYLKETSILLFCFVRHPFERLVSTYMDKVVGNKKFWGSTKWLHLNPKTFPQFIKLLLQEHKKGNVNILGTVFGKMSILQHPIRRDRKN